MAWNIMLSILLIIIFLLFLRMVYKELFYTSDLDFDEELIIDIQSLLKNGDKGYDE